MIFSKNHINKGQVSEVVAFAILIIAITLFMIIYHVFIVSGAIEGLSIVADRHETERLKAGVNALSTMTEERTGYTMLNLIGTAAYNRVDEIDFGAPGKVNVSKELIWRMNALFGENWHITVPFPTRTAEIQMVIVADTSGSLCDDLDNMRKNLPGMINNLVDAGRSVQATLYLLGGSNCQDDPLIRQRCGYTFNNIDCSAFESKNLRCKSIDYIKNKVKCVLTSQTSEDWGNGIACASKYGPSAKVTKSGIKDGWSEGSVRIGIVLSDELPGGSECINYGSCSSQEASLQNGIKGANEMNVIVFSLMAEPCSCVTPKGTVQCNCYESGLLERYFDDIATKTGGKKYSLSESLKASDAINDIMTSIIIPEGVDKLDIGAKIPSKTRLRTYEILVPLPDGNYAKVYIVQWP